MKKQKFIYFLILAICIFYSSMPATVFGQTVTIEMPDTVLASAVRDALGLGATDPITNVAMLNLRRLEATPSDPTDDKITDLTGLEHATNLTLLDLNDNAIIDVGPLSNLTKLTVLKLISNSITDVSPLANLTSLARLAIKGNPILDTSPLYSIFLSATIDITPTQYPPWDVNQDGSVDGTDVELVRAALGQHSPDITDPRTDVNGSLHVDNADLLLVVEHVSGFSTVDMPDAHLAAAVRAALGLGADIPLIPPLMQALTHMDAQDKAINDLTGLEAATNLTELNLSGNSISLIGSLSGLRSLTTLDLSGNSIGDISSLSGLTGLTSLDLSDNAISSISSLSGLRSLTTLDLSGNTISSMSSLSRLTSLTMLNLGHNSVSDVNPLSGLTDLTRLYLNNNIIGNVNALSSLTSLVGLSLSDNVIQSVSPLVPLRDLRELYIGNNPVLDTSPLYPLVPLDVDVPIDRYPPWDVNEDGMVDDTDANLVAAALGQTGSSILNPRTDVNADGTVNILDVTLVRNNFRGPRGFEIPDPNLAAAIRTELGLGANATITETDMQRLTRLVVIDSGIRNLTGLAAATNLTTLNLSENSVRDVSPLAGLTTLTDLALQENSISDVGPLAGLTSVTGLNLSNNAISDVSPLAGLTGLYYLYLENNSISDVRPLGGLTNLIQLHLRHNVISDVGPLSGLTRPTHLDLGNNLISDIRGLAGLTTLTHLKLDYNRITDVDALKDLTNLIDFRIDYNLLTDVSGLSGLASLTKLRIENNPLTDVSGLSGLTSLTNLYLNDNLISDVGPLSGLTSLTSLFLRNNQITDVSPLAMLTGLTTLRIMDNPVLPASLGALETLTNLTHKDFEIPETVEVPDDNLAAALREALGLAQHLPILRTELAALTELNARNRSITDLSGLQEATGLTTLNLSSNSISDMQSLAALTNLTMLNLRDNQVTDVSQLVRLTNLETLDLTGNTGITNAALLFPLKQDGTRITGVVIPDVAIFPDAALADIVGSALSLPANQPILLSDLERLTTLTASNRGIVDLTGIEKATNLTELTLSGNQITDVSALSELTRLTYLDLRNNQITDVSPLVGLTNLRTLNLTGNTGITNPAVLYSLQQGVTTITGITVPASVVFTDTALADAIRSVLGLGVAASIPSDRLAALTTLTASNRGIANLTGLENAVSLTRLTLSNNEIMNIVPLAGLTQLTTLDLRNNQITDVSPLAGLTNLRTLNLTDNAVSNPEALINLQEGGTRITGVTVPDEVIFPDAALAGLIRETLILEDGMPIFSNKLAALTSLKGSQRGITDLTGLEQATGLTLVLLGGNTISDLSPLSNLTDLETLDLWANRLISKRISDISPLANLTNLTYLRLWGNLVSDISVLSRLTSLTDLILDYNLITDVSPLADLTSLKWLSLKGNPVTNPEALFPLKQRGGTLIDIYIPSVVAIPDTALAAAVREALDLADTAPIPPDDLAALTTLDASSLGITQLTGLETATGLTRLILNDNQIRDVSSLAELTPLETLNLRDNQITDALPLTYLTRLKTLDVTNNPIENTGVLFILKQAGTRITGVEVPDSDSVFFADMALEEAVREALDLAEADPTSPDAVATLTTLDASRRGISDLQGIEHAMQLETLYLRYNEITDVLQLATLTGLTRLVLDGNPVENPEVLFRLKQAGTRITGVEVPDSVFFADMALEEAVRRVLRLAEHLPILPADMQQRLTTLTVSRKGITDLTGLQAATGLTRLTLSYNAITDVSPLQDLENLTTLDLRNNQIMDVSPLAGLTSLRQLYLRGNENLTTGLKQLVPLTDLQVDIDLPEPIAFLDTNLAAVVRVEVNSFLGLNLQPGDPIFPEDVAQLTALTASNSSIDDLTGLEYAVGLTLLRLSGNAIENLSPLSNLSLLQTLDLSNNAIETLTPLKDLNSLTTLNLSNNAITDVLPLASLTNLRDLNLSGNAGITNPEVLFRLKQAGTQITGVEVPDFVVFNDTALEEAVRRALRLSAHLSILPTDMQTLRTLTVSRKGVTDLTGLETATGLTRLTLSYNAITDVSPLQPLENLATLDLRNNEIMDVLPLAELTTLTSLTLTGNPVSNPGVLFRLKQGGTRITGVTIPDAVAFPDTALEEAVRTALGLSSTEPILPHDLAGLTTLSASSLGIVDLTGLEHATGLTDLTLSNNDIIDVLPLAGLTSLTQLNLIGNPITNPGVLYPLQQAGTTITGVTIPSAVVFTDTALDTAVRSALRISAGDTILPDALAMLTRLTAARKGITDLSGLEHATGLERLDLGQNQNITDISALANLIRLENLDLADNQVTAISALSSLTRLEVLDLRDNEVTDTARLSEMTHLKNLYVRGNENLSSLKELVRLTEAGTRVDITLPRPVSFRDDNLKSALRTALDALSTLTLLPNDPIFPGDMAMLTEFDASTPTSGEEIVNLTGLETATALTTLNLSKNQIVSLSPLARLTELTELNVSSNSISSLSSLSRLTNLTTLNLSSNKNISSVSSLSRLTSLTDLNLSENRITSVSSLSDLTSLTDLNLSENRIRDVLPLQGLSSLDTLNLLGNTGLTTEKVEVLYKLLQGGTTITVNPDITLPVLTNIVKFNNADLEAAVRSALRISRGYPVSEAKITELTRLTTTRKEIDDLTGLERATKLTTLDLGDNEIETLTPLQGLTNLTNLDLADNEIVGLSSLENLTALTNLNLADNEIENVTALSGLTNLKTLDLRNNDIIDVAPLRDLVSLTRIYLRGNENLENLEWLGALENLSADIQLPDVVRLPDTNLDREVRAALRDAGNTVSNDLPMSEELLESLVALDASSEGISDLTGCEHMTELTTLDLRNNQITDVSPLSRLYSLETLMLDGNPILDTSVLRELERRGTDIDITIYRYPSWDVNQDSDVDEADVFLITATITGESPDVNGDGTPGDAADTQAADANKDGNVDTDDLLLVFEKFDRPVNLAAPLLSAESAGLDWQLLERIDADGLRVQLEILRAENDGSLKYQQAIAFLQAVLVALHPNQTLLLANYPNPFNPETWIPYQLARGSNVWITIYDTRGAVVRRLELGYRAEGYYRVRGRAAHWEGRNNVGERVASGLYFYQLETDNVSLLRKMVILK